MAQPDPAFIVFSDDWGEHPSSSQHLFRQIAREHPVLWVNTIGMRNPTLKWADVRKAWRKVSRMLRPAPAPAPAPVSVSMSMSVSETASETVSAAASTPRESAGSLQLRVCQPVMLPFSGVGVIRRFNRRSVLREVRRAAEEQGLVKPVVVSTVPNACDYVGELDASRVVYYCVDDFSQWPGLDHDLVRGMERQLIAGADVLIATSRHLFDKLSASGKPLHLLTHGVDLAHFSQEAPAEHPVLASIPAPRVGYFGLFDERSNEDLLVALAERMPEVSFVFTGPVAAEPQRLRSLPNVHFTGPVAYRELPAVIKGLSALFLPYVVNEATASISPLKLKEYLATGKPVVSTPMPEALIQGVHLTIADGADEWQAALRAALGAGGGSKRDAMREALAGESWAEKARQFVSMCSLQGALPATRVLQEA